MRSRIAKADVSRWPLVGTLARELGVIFVTRGDAGSGARVLQAARAALESGLRVLELPEGTTTPGGTVLPFRTGLFGVARIADVPVVPESLSLTSRPSWPGLATTASCRTGLTWQASGRLASEFASAPPSPRAGTVMPARSRPPCTLRCCGCSSHPEVFRVSQQSAFAYLSHGQIPLFSASQWRHFPRACPRVPARCSSECRMTAAPRIVRVPDWPPTRFAGSARWCRAFTLYTS